MTTRNAVYLLHFDKALCHAQHYMGSAADLEARLEKHRTGNGARLMAVIKDLGIGWEVARIWEHETLKKARLAESRYKRVYKSARKLCPICRNGNK